MQTPLNRSDNAAVANERVAEMAAAADDTGADAMVISRTALRAAEVVIEIAQRPGKPVVTSNQALMAVALRRSPLPCDDSPLREHSLVKRKPRQLV